MIPPSESPSPVREADSPTAGSNAVDALRLRSAPAVFVDRDGTLNPDLHYLKDAERLELYPGVADGLRLARAHGFWVVCVTNQSGIGRGLYATGDVARIHQRLNDK